MFLMEAAVTPLTLFFFPSKNSPPSSVPSLPFDQALIAGLHSLLPIPNSSSSIPLSWLCRAVDFLALTLADAATLFSDPTLSSSDRAALATYLDYGIALPNACNAIAAHIDRLLRQHLLRFALHHLSGLPPPRPRCLAEWDRDRLPRRGIHDLAGMLVIIFNKYVLDPKMYNWPFPISLTMVHMAFCSTLAFLLVHGLRVAEPPTSPPMTRDLYITSVIPIGTLYTFSLWFSNSAYIYLSVSFIQMLKALAMECLPNRAGPIRLGPKFLKINWA